MLEDCTCGANDINFVGLNVVGSYGNSTCSLYVGGGTRFANNSAGHDGSQISTRCAGAMRFDDTLVAMSVGEPQVCLCVQQCGSKHVMRLYE